MSDGSGKAPPDRGKAEAEELAAAQSLLDWGVSGWLEEPELARLGVLLNRPIVIRSSLPAVEDDTFPEWVLMPGLFTADIIRRVQEHGLRTTSWLIGPRASVVLGDTDQQRSPTPIECEDEEEANEEDPIRTSPEPQGPRGALQVRQTRIRIVITSSCPRDDLGEVRDLVLQAVRGASHIDGPEQDPSFDNVSLNSHSPLEDVPDHMLAGAYLRQMMVVEEPGSGDGTHTAIFTFASSFDQSPEVYTLEFQACARGVDAGGAMTGSLAALVDYDRIRIDPEAMKWLHANSASLEDYAAKMDGTLAKERDSGFSGVSPPPSSEEETSTEPPSVLFCRRQIEQQDENEGKDEGFFAHLGCASLGQFATCLASCFGFNRPNAIVSPPPSCVPPPPPPPLLVHEI